MRYVCTEPRANGGAASASLTACSASVRFKTTIPARCGSADAITSRAAPVTVRATLSTGNMPYRRSALNDAFGCPSAVIRPKYWSVLCPGS